MSLSASQSYLTVLPRLVNSSVVDRSSPFAVTLHSIDKKVIHLLSLQLLRAIFFGIFKMTSNVESSDCCFPSVQ